MKIITGVHSAGQRPCGTWRNGEDWLSFDEHHVGVYDGATPAGKALYVGRDDFTDASWASQTTASIVKDHARSWSAIRSSRSDIAPIYTRLRVAFKKATGLEVKSLQPFQRPATTMSVVIQKGNYLRFTQIGDSPIGVLLKTGKVKMLHGDPVLLQNDRNISQELKNLRSKDPDALHVDIMARRQLPRIRHLMNAAHDGYGVVTPQHPDKIYLQEMILHKNDVTGVVVFTDGLAEAYDTFDVFNSAEKFVKTVVNHPDQLHEVHKQLRIKQNEDPECKTVPRIKMGDDIAAIVARPS